MRIGIVSFAFGHSFEHAQALAAGLSRHGVESTRYSERAVPDEEIVACWGWETGRKLRARAKRVLVMERGFIHRMRYASLGWNGLNGHASFPRTNRPDRLWQILPEGMCPWSEAGDYALIVGQHPFLRGLDLDGFYRQCVSWCREHSLAARFRPHPWAVQCDMIPKVEGATQSRNTLYADLERAAVVLTFNSNTGVDALLAGRPTVAVDAGSMAFLTAASEFRIQDEPDRISWAQRLAWCQWTMEELQNGVAWEHVRQAFED